MIVTLCLAASLIPIAVGVGANPYHEIWKNISVDYTPHVRPVLSANTTTIITVTNELYRLVKVDEADESLSLIQWVYWEWTDEHLVWSVSDFDGVQFIRMPYDSVWRPDIVSNEQ